MRVLLVGTGYAMPVAIRTSVVRKGSFEFWSPISLYHLNASREALAHGCLQKDGALVTGQGGPEHDGRFLGVTVDPREGEQVPNATVSIWMTARAQAACGTAPRFWFLRHLERITYFSARIS